MPWPRRPSPRLVHMSAAAQPLRRAPVRAPNLASSCRDTVSEDDRKSFGCWGGSSVELPATGSPRWICICIPTLIWDLPSPHISIFRQEQTATVIRKLSEKVKDCAWISKNAVAAEFSCFQRLSLDSRVGKMMEWVASVYKLMRCLLLYTPCQAGLELKVITEHPRKQQLLRAIEKDTIYFTFAIPTRGVQTTVIKGLVRDPVPVVYYWMNKNDSRCRCVVTGLPSHAITSWENITPQAFLLHLVKTILGFMMTVIVILIQVGQWAACLSSGNTVWKHASHQNITDKSIFHSISTNKDPEGNQHVPIMVFKSVFHWLMGGWNLCEGLSLHKWRTECVRNVRSLA